MAEQASGYKHSDSDRALDKAAQAENAQSENPGPTHDPVEISKHDDKGKDRLFEGREQHDDARRDNERVKREKDVDRHNHADDEDADTTTTK